MKIGILNLQGAVSEHYEITKKTVNKLQLNYEVENVRYAEEVATCDAIIISGGESTVIGKLIQRREIDKTIKENNIAVMGTCAGMVLLANKVDFDQPLLKLMDITVKRNAFGRQKDSFESEITFQNQPYHGVFIRAPAIEKTGPQVKILSKFQNKIIAAQEKNHLAIAYHPELTNDTRIHEYFIKKVIPFE